MTPPGNRNDQTLVVSPMGRPCHESASSISWIAQPRSPLCGPQVHDVPAHLLCHAKGGTGRKKRGLPGAGGESFSSSAFGGPLNFPSVESSLITAEDLNFSFDTMARNNFNPCGGQLPGSTPRSQTGACWNVTRTLPSPCLNVSSVLIIPDFGSKDGPTTIPTEPQRWRRPSVDGVYVATGMVLTLEDEKHVSQSDWVDEVRIRWVCVTDEVSSFGWSDTL